MRPSTNINTSKSNKRLSRYQLGTSTSHLKKMKTSSQGDEVYIKSDKISDLLYDYDDKYNRAGLDNNNNTSDGSLSDDENFDENEVENVRQKMSKKMKIKSLPGSKAKFRNLSKTRKIISMAHAEDDININTDKDKLPEEEEMEIQFLPCRETEQMNIYTYIKKGLETVGSYQSLYISGMPGTGKTASVSTVIKKLSKEAEKKLIPNFAYLYLNGMKVTNPNNVFKLIYDFIFSDGRSASINKSTQILDNFFKNRNDFDSKTILKDISNSHIVIVIDEIDCLINKKQVLLYNLFNWTTYPHSKLIIISISNTLDLPEKLQPKTRSRMGQNKLMFKPYVKEELYKILSVKIENINMFSEDALKLSSMKVAAVNGDLRRILQICRRAKELFEAENEYRNKNNNDKIEKSHILKATNELFDSKLVKVIKSLQLYEKVIIATILFRMKVENDCKIRVSEVYDKKDFFFSKLRQKINFEEFTMIIYNLVKLKIIDFTDGFNENFINNCVCIKFYTDEFMSAVEGDENFKVVLTELQNLV
jgi:Cdc6-like AAA superfamily ATPase